MARGLLHVETAPASPDVAEAYHASYERHIEQLLAVEGVRSARRYRIVDHDGAFAAVYELEGDDLAEVRARIAAAGQDGRVAPPVGLRTDPPPRVRLLELLDG